MIDFPRAWQIARHPDAIKRHEPECSFSVSSGGFLCDCRVLREHPEYKSQDLFGLHGVLITMKMTKEQMAALLNGREIGQEITKDEEHIAKESGLLVVFGASDDLMEFRGKYRQEFDCYDGGKFPFIEAIWGRDDISWQYETELPHATFDIMEDGEVYCRGIVIDMGDI